MIKALAVKELREVLGIAAAALGCYLVMVSALVGLPPFARFFPGARFAVPFEGSVARAPFAWVSLLFAAALGFRQSAWEAGQGTYQLLLHRPVRREVVFLTKLAVGAGVFVACTGVPI